MEKAFLFFLVDSRAISTDQHGFLPRRSCLANVLVHAEAVACMMDEGPVADVVYHDLAKAVDSANDRFPVPKTKSIGLDDVIAIHRTGRASRVHVEDYSRRLFQFAVQSSVIIPL